MIKTLSILLLSSLILSIGYVYFEPDIVAAAASTPTPIVATLTVTSEISLTSPGNITMSTLITMSEHKAVGISPSAWNVKTNNQAGYKLELKGDQTNIMHNVSSSWADYTEATPGTPEPWSVATTAYEFGFSVYGTDSPTSTWGWDIDCLEGGNTPSLGLRYRGFTSTNAIQVATRATTTVTAGVDTFLCLGAEQGDAIYAPSGTYTANITGTATTL